MTALKSVFTLISDTILDDTTRYRIVKSGYRRIPVLGQAKEESIVGMLNVRSLIGLDFQERLVLVGELELERLKAVAPNMHFADVVSISRDREVGIVVITESGGVESKALGVVTFRDVMGALSDGRCVGGLF